jgi:hypothetical protein
MKMTDEHLFRGLLHWATHRIPGVPAHAERPVGHQGRARHGRVWRRSVASHPSPNHGWNHSAARPPRVMVAWQNRIAAFFGQEL